MKVTFVDTSVLLELLEVPGKAQQAAPIQAEFRERVSAGERFVIPITAVIETGNHIAQARDGALRRQAAVRLVELLRGAIICQAPYVLNQVAWDDGFLEALCGGDSTAMDFITLAGTGLLGAGDVAVLVERDRFVDGSALSRQDVRIWTLDQELMAHA